MQKITVLPGLALGMVALLGACGDGIDLGVGGAGQALVRGRVTARDGSELDRVLVQVGDDEVRTDVSGAFEIEVPAETDHLVRVRSEEFAGSERIVRLREGDELSLEIGVLSMRRIRIPDAERGGRFEGEEGFAIELPERALRKPDGDVATGEAELRYALVRRPDLVGALPELRIRTEDDAEARLRSEGGVDVRFRQGAERLDFEGEARTEVPLPPESGLREGDSIGAYHYNERTGYWERQAEAEIEQGKWVAELDDFSWWTAAEIIEELSCVNIDLRTQGDQPATESVVTAEGSTQLWLSTAEADAEGMVCVQAPPDTDLVLSSFRDTGSAQSEWAALATTPDSVAVCGEEFCASLGVQRFKPVTPPSPMGDAGPPTDGGVEEDAGVSDGGGGDGGSTTTGPDDGGTTGMDMDAGAGGTGGSAGPGESDASEEQDAAATEEDAATQEDAEAIDEDAGVGEPDAGSEPDGGIVDDAGVLTLGDGGGSFTATPIDPPGILR